MNYPAEGAHTHGMTIKYLVWKITGITCLMRKSAREKITNRFTKHHNRREPICHGSISTISSDEQQQVALLEGYGDLDDYIFTLFCFLTNKLHNFTALYMGQTARTFCCGYSAIYRAINLTKFRNLSFPNYAVPIQFGVGDAENTIGSGEIGIRDLK